MSQAMSPSAKRTYGIQRVCRAWRLARATVQRHKAQACAEPRILAKRGPKTILSDDAILTEIRAVLASPVFVGGLPPVLMPPALRGIRAIGGLDSPDRVQRTPWGLTRSRGNKQL